VACACFVSRSRCYQF